ncbi:MAG: flagellar export protein FliJ [Ignavibacteriae bacterium]|nr:flagellar export protein FliJ [Ignavibacteriota bacterium]
MRVSDSPLSTVIRVRDMQLKKTQRELAVIKVERQTEEVRLTSLEEAQSNAMTEAVRKMKTRAVDLQTSQAFLQSLSRKIEHQEEKVREVTTAEEGKRVELVERSQSKQMVEKIDQRRRDEETKEQERKAQRVIDVLAQRIRTDL